MSRHLARALLCAFALSFLLPGAAALAQGKKQAFPLPIPLPNLRTDSTDAVQSAGSPKGLNDLLGALDVKLLADLQYAKKLSDAAGNKITGNCYAAWIDIIQTRQKAVTDDKGNPVDLPDPHIITDFEKLVELRNALQPEAPFMVACSPVASMVKTDILGFIGKVLGGATALTTLVPGL